MIEGIRCVPPESASRFEFGPDSRNRVFDGLKLPNRLAKLFALLGVGHIEIDQPGRCTEGICREEYGGRIRQLL